MIIGDLLVVPIINTSNAGNIDDESCGLEVGYQIPEQLEGVAYFTKERLRVTKYSQFKIKMLCLGQIS
ncbi:hypothetical protein [Psychrobacter sp. S1-30-MNA-CIBAN-0213]|uniref:hypothetical protein n=1 Tax=unclassified Psychrobacter TaxID=196806 RepID=UPI00331D20A8